MNMNKNNEQIAQETWVSIGKSIRKEYFISDRGHIKTVDLRNGEVKFSCGSINKHTGYVSFNGPRGNEYVHRAVAKAFCV